MRLGPIALRLRTSDTRFGDMIAGSSELAVAEKATLQDEMAFVIQLGEVASPNTQENTISQLIHERFGVLVAIDNSLDKTGMTAFDSLEETRSEIFKSLLGWQMTGAESVISYAGGHLEELHPRYLWYRFDFDVATRIDTDDGVEMGDLVDFESIYAQWKMDPTGEGIADIIDTLPLVSAAVDAEQIVDLS